MRLRGENSLFQPRLFIFGGHRALLQRFGEALSGGTLLLAPGRLGGLAAIEREGRLTAVEQGAELLAGDLEEGCESAKLALAQAGQFDQPVLELFPDIDAQAQA